MDNKWKLNGKTNEKWIDNGKIVCYDILIK